MRALMIITLVATSACGVQTGPPGISILLSSDGSHACAGAVTLRVTLKEVNGDAIETEAPAAVRPEQLDCDFDVGVAEALFGLEVGEIETGVSYTLTVELEDSTGLTLALGMSSPFQANPRKEIEPIKIQLARLPGMGIGTVLVDPFAHPALRVSGELEIVMLAGTGAVGTRQIEWPGDDSLKRPLRVSGISLDLAMDLRLEVELTKSGGGIVTFESTSFRLGPTEQEAFAAPELTEM